MRILPIRRRGSPLLNIQYKKMSDKRNKAPFGWVNTRAMAERLGVPIRSLLRGARTGRIKADYFCKAEDGTYTFHEAETKAQWFAGIDPQYVKSPKGGKTSEEIAAIQDASAAEAPDRPSLDLTGASDRLLSELRERLDKMNGTEVRIAKDAATVIKAEIELAQLQNSLVRREDVYVQMYEFGQMVRQRLEGVPVRVVDSVMGADGRVEVMQIISQEIDSALEGLTRTPEIKNE